MRCRIFVERNPLAQCQIQTDRIDKEQRQNVISKIVKMILGSAICENVYFASESFTYWFGREITCSWVIIPGSNFRLNRYKWQYLPSGNFCYRIMLSNLSNLLIKLSILHYNDVIMGAMASQITSLTIVDSTVYSGAYQRKHQIIASLAFVRGIRRWPVNSPHKGPVTRKMFPSDDVIMMELITDPWRLSGKTGSAASYAVQDCCGA